MPNADLDRAVGALLQSENFDRVLLAAGDGDFIRVVQALQNRGCRVETVAFENVSQELRREADLYMSGYLVPNLLPTHRSPVWAGVGEKSALGCVASVTTTRLTKVSASCAS